MTHRGVCTRAARIFDCSPMALAFLNSTDAVGELPMNATPEQ